jgi:hypothetical protein
MHCWRVGMQGVSIEKLEELYATAMDYGITLVTISHEPGAKNGIRFEFSLCLSRACLGKMIVFRYKWLKTAVFRRYAIGWLGWACPCP